MSIEPGETRRALVVGAQGVLGTAIAHAFAAAGWEVTRAGRRPEEDPDLLRVDLADAQSVERASEAANLIINTAHHPDLLLEKTVLRRGGTLIDLVELSRRERQELEAAAARSPGLVIVHTGLGGIAYIAIADLLRATPDADGAEYALTVSAAGSSGRAGGLFAHRLLTGFSHHATAPIPFPAPIGKRRCLEVGGDFGGPLRTSIAGTPVRHYLYMHPPALNAVMRLLNATRIIGALPSALFTGGARRPADELSDEPVCEWVAVSRSGRRVTSRSIKGRGYYAMTVAATLALAGELPSDQTGVRRVEDLFTLTELAPALERVGIVVDEGAR